MMLPAQIHRWFIQYGVDPLIGWEALEVAGPRWDENTDTTIIEDEAELLSSMFLYIDGMIQICADEESALKPLLQHVIPMTIALSPYMGVEIRTRILETADSVPGYGVFGMFKIALSE